MLEKEKVAIPLCLWHFKRIVRRSVFHFIRHLRLFILHFEFLKIFLFSFLHLPVFVLIFRKKNKSTNTCFFFDFPFISISSKEFSAIL